MTVLLEAPNVELSGPRRKDARPGLAKMYRVPLVRAWWPAVGAPLERRVRRQRTDRRLCSAGLLARELFVQELEEISAQFVFFFGELKVRTGFNEARLLIEPGPI